ncbi:MAG: LLM class flavin-dependent oxidoreductase [Deltaproteobacteria bacterium]|nr:LLM class flavin-dependent oxidoreductase [Deltaproteobacteria bacterium]
MTARTGLLPFWKNYDRKLYLKAAILADDLGYDSFWIPEAWGYEIFSLLTEVAVHTKQIKIGTGIVNCFSRSPGLLAMNAATVDEISEGRLILGLGTSGKRVIEGFHARAFDKPLTQLRDVIRVTKTLLSGKRLHESGAKLHDYRPFELAMDGWIPTFWPYAKLEQGHAWIAEGAAKAGRDARDIATAPFTTVIPLGDAGIQQARQIISFYIGGMGDYYKELLTGFGYGDECKRVDELYRDKKTRSQAADAVSDGMIEALTIAGDPKYCISELQRRREYGIDLPILSLPSNLPWEMIEMFIRTMAPST